MPRAPQTVARRHILTPALLAAFVAIIIVLLVALFVGIANLRTVEATSEAVAQTYSVELALRELLATLVDAETGERGFIITGQDSYLDPYQRARDEISSALARVRALVADGPEQRVDVQRLSRATELKLTELSDAIRQRRESGFAAAQAQVATNVEKRTMDQIRAIMALLETREEARLAARRQDAARSYHVALLTEFGTTALALVALVGLFFSTFRYGTMRLRATQEAEAQQAQLREALQQKDDFVALVSHELRTPANTIAGWARMLVAGTAQPGQRDHGIATICRNADSLRQLIDDLMDTSQLLSGRMRLTTTSVAVQEVVRDAIETVRLSAENKGVVLTEAIQPDLPDIKGDAGRLKQVVWNLLANAIKFTPPGGHVTVGLTSNDGGLRLEVSDTGEGIDAVFLPHVFERYRQAAAPTSSQRGVGLGLAIVRHLVELHGGTVTAQSAGVGQGSAFVVELPLAGAGHHPVTRTDHAVQA
jgi:signal transduction histidine kinase